MLLVAEIAYLGALWLIPLWLVVRAWRERHALRNLSKRDALLCRISLGLLAVTEIGLLLIGVFVILDSLLPRVLFRNIQPFWVGQIGLILCSTSLVLSLVIPRHTKEAHLLRKSMVYASAYLILIGIFFLFVH